MKHLHLFAGGIKDSPVIDLACGDGHNGLFLASKGLSVILADKSQDALEKAGLSAESSGLAVQLQQIDLEIEGLDPLAGRAFSAILVFRYLHRPLIPCIRRALRKGGILVYETFTTDQALYGKPKNPDHLLRHGELLAWFHDWEIISYFEGIKEPDREAVAQLVCRKPLAD
jgi:SAM-dependent methyltransferase